MTDQAPWSQARLLEFEPESEGEDTRPWGLVTDSATTWWSGEEHGVALERSTVHRGAFTLRTDGPLLAGLPGLEAYEETVHTRTPAQRANRTPRRTPSAAPSGAPYRPKGVPLGIAPKTTRSLDPTRRGITSRGGKTLLSETHSTIIDGESRALVYPSSYPYTAVCKLYSSYQPTAGASWVPAGEATGYLIGRSTMMTSGHVGPPTNGAAWAIKVIPACWNGQSVFGAGVVSYVRGYHSWNSDSGSDIKVCQLWDPLGDRVGYFGYRGYNSAWEDGDYWTMAGFPYDISLTSMSYESAIAVRDDDDGDDINVNGTTYDTTQVESDADEASGVSGAPLWGWWDDGPYAIGVHHGVEHDGTIFGTETLSCASGGAGFTQAAAWGRSSWG
ncbi:trypsin-like serine peptidase [Amycolatopsis kentuckyensis]|uniref:trypsin-like serine peptidase n=1 Tax=Amycolatopsis kentuckyensis TaxID=218823 RepID=UPI000A39D053|nr:trypsin-like serine protease [Amycolatopsis kentuckyensis]